MLKNFFVVAGRNLLRQKTYSLLNLLGLSLGIACILLLGLHVRQELSYDRNFPIFSIVISCLGLFGLAAYAAELRTLEIGIRKTIGASTSSLVRLLSVDFMTPVLLGNLLSWPLAGWAIHSWLTEFTYRIDIGWWVFALSLILTLAIALLTIGFRCWQTARANPVKSLRSE